MIVRLENISKYFPGTVALKDVTLELKGGEIHGLLGQNGAGKSTLVKIIYGIHQPDTGSIYLDGSKVLFKSPRDARMHGIILVHQELTLFPHLTVLENIALLGSLYNAPLFREFKQEEFYDKATKRFEELKVNIDPYARVMDLRASEKMLTQLIAALVMDARVLLLDEPTSPLIKEEVENLFEILRNLKGRGLVIVFITHRLEEAFEICDKITILRNGIKVGTFNTKELKIEDAIKMMLGTEVEVLSTSRKTMNLVKEEQPLLRIEGLSTMPSKMGEIPLKSIDLEVYRGEVLVVFGLLGAGKTELGKSLIGLQRIKTGRIIFDGKEAHIKSPIDARRLGIIYLPEDRRNEGLFLGLSVLHNATISSLERFSKLFFIKSKDEKTEVLNYFRKLNVVMPSLTDSVSKLSGGNQQKVLLSRALLAKPKLIVLDEPTIGIDVGAKIEIRRLVYELAKKEGISVLWLTSDVDEALGVADRIAVIYEGEIKKVVPNVNLTRDVLTSMLYN